MKMTESEIDKKREILRDIAFNLEAIKLDVQREILNIGYDGSFFRDSSYYEEDIQELKKQFKDLFKGCV